MISSVYDCMVFLQAATNRTGPAGTCLALVDERRVELFISASVMEEIRDVLARPAIRRKFPQLTDQQVADFIEHILDMGKMVVDDVLAVYSLPRDPDDEPYLHLAMAAHAEFLVSRDKDLLSLVDDDTFRKQFPSLSIVDPKAFLAHAASENATDSGQS